VSKAKRLPGWEPKVKFKELVRIMVVADLKLAPEESMQKKKRPVCPARFS
jgi:GDPmannose 4,6-dehydratase